MTDASTLILADRHHVWVRKTNRNATLVTHSMMKVPTRSPVNMGIKPENKVLVSPEI